MNEGEEEEAGGEPDGQGLARFLLNGEEPGGDDGRLFKTLDPASLATDNSFARFLRIWPANESS